MNPVVKGLITRSIIGQSPKQGGGQSPPLKGALTACHLPQQLFAASAAHQASCVQPYASIRHASLASRQEFLAGAPPPPISSDQDIIGRDAANVPDWYAPWTNCFLRVADEFIAH